MKFLNPFHFTIFLDSKYGSNLIYLLMSISHFITDQNYFLINQFSFYNIFLHENLFLIVKTFRFDDFDSYL